METWRIWLGVVSFLLSVTEDFVLMTDQDNFIIGNDSYIPNKFIISVNQVRKKLARINTKKAAEPDNIPSWILKECVDILSGPVCALFNSSLREGFVPNMWKSAYIHQVPKVSPPTLLEKHIRPISLTPVLAKIMESFTCQRVINYISGVLDPQQYGSRKNSSTVHALVELIHCWQQGLDEPGKILRVLFLDYSKAFDRVDHKILLKKLANTAVSWICAFEGFVRSRYQFCGEWSLAYTSMDEQPHACTELMMAKPNWWCFALSLPTLLCATDSHCPGGDHSLQRVCQGPRCTVWSAHDYG